MKKLLFISALVLMTGCSKQIEFEKLLPQAFAMPVPIINNMSEQILISDYFPHLENIDSVTCRNARIVSSENGSDTFLLSPVENQPFYIVDVWKKGGRASLIAMNSNNQRLASGPFITSDIDNRERIILKSNEPVDQWLVFWQNVEIPVRSLDITEEGVAVPVPENARWLENSELRVMAFSDGVLSNQADIYLTYNKVTRSINRLRNIGTLNPHIPKMAQQVNNERHKSQIAELQNARLEWWSGDEISLLDDNDVLVYARSYMGSTSFFAYNKSDHPVERKLQIPHNIRMGNLKTYFDQSIKQSGDNIVIHLSPDSYEIATSEIL